MASNPSIVCALYLSVSFDSHARKVLNTNVESVVPVDYLMQSTLCLIRLIFFRVVVIIFFLLLRWHDYFAMLQRNHFDTIGHIPHH